MAIDFPASPSVNDIHTSGGKRWTWNGTSWERSGTPGPGDTISATNDNTTSTLYPVLVTGTGSNTAKIATTSSKSVSFNASNGNLTATTFTGTLNTAAQTNITSVGTLGSLNVTGDVSVGGVLTYEDVKNVDSVGIITARDDVHIADKIVHTGDTNTAIRFPAADTITAETAGSERVRISSTGLITQTNFNGLGLHLSGGQDPTIRVQDSDGTNQYVDLAHNSGDSYIVTRNNTSHGGFRVYSQNGSETLTRLRITSGGNVNIGTGETTQTARMLNVYGGATRVTQTSGGNTIEAFGHTTSGQSYGLLVNAGSTSGDYCANFRDKDGTTLLRIRGDGKVGIGSAIPTRTLDVAGGAQFKTNGPAVRIESSPGTNFTQLQLVNSGGSFYIGRENTAGDWFSSGTGYASVLRSDGAYPLIFRVNSSNRLTITSGGYVGIGTDDPDKKLEVWDATQGVIRIRGGGAGSNSSRKADLSLFASGAREYVVRADASDAAFKIIDVSGSNAERLCIASNGKVGIGTVVPSENLTVHTASGNTKQVLSSHAGFSELDFVTASTLRADVFANASEFTFTTRTAIPIVFRTNGTNERLSILSTGQVRIDGPTAAAHGLRFTPNGWNSYDNRMGYCGTSGADFWWSSNWNPTDGARDHSGYATNFIRQNISTGYLSFGTGPVNTSALERLRITSDGKVLIGPGNIYNPQGLLHIVGDDNSNGPELYLQVNNNNTTDNIGALWFGNNVDKSLVKLAGHTHTANNTADFTVSTSNAGTLGEKLRIRSDGKLQIGSVGGNSTYLTTSTNAALDIWGDGSAYPTLRLGTEVLDTEGEDIRFGRTDHGSTDIRYHSIISRHMSSGASNYLQFRIHDGGGSPFQSQKTVLHLNGLGNMGLGTNSPNHYNNYSTITLNGATGGEIDFEDDGTLLGDHFCNVNGHYFTAGRSAAMPFIWQTHNGSSVGQRMQLTSTGELNIGGSLTQTTFQAQITGDLLLQKQAAAYDNPLLELYATNNSAHGGSIKFTAMYGSKYELARIKSWGGNGSPGPNGGNLTIHTGDGTEKIRIQADGNINFGVNEPVIRIDSSNSSNSSALRVEIDGTEQFRFDASSITYKDATNSARGILIGPLNYHLDTNGYVNFSQWYLGTDWNVLEIFGYINPNSAGSGAYTDPLHMYVYRGIGWDQANNATAHWIYSVHVAPPARQVFPSGSGMSGNAGVSAVWYHPSRGIVGNKSSNGADYLRLVIPNANQSYNYQKNFRILRRY